MCYLERKQNKIYINNIMEINFTEKKYIIENIQKLSIDQQRQIFFILKKYLDNNINDSKWYTKNQNGIFINFSYIDNTIINDINLFINECNIKKEKLQKLQEEIQLIENKEICYKIAPENNEIDEKEDFGYIYNIIDVTVMNNMNEHLNKKHIKKQNLQTKFVNATKRYTKCVNAEKKFEETNIFFLDYEQYIN
jgi:hypothetical protein